MEHRTELTTESVQKAAANWLAERLPHGRIVLYPAPDGTIAAQVWSGDMLVGNLVFTEADDHSAIENAYTFFTGDRIIRQCEANAISYSHDVPEGHDLAYNIPITVEDMAKQFPHKGTARFVFDDEEVIGIAQYAPEVYLLSLSTGRQEACAALDYAGVIPGTSIVYP